MYSQQYRSRLVLLVVTIVLSFTSVILAIPPIYQQTYQQPQMHFLHRNQQPNYHYPTTNQMIPQESARNEIEDDLTAADLDLDGAATSNNENDDDGDFDDNEGQDSNIRNAKINVDPRDLMTAAGHHHHHGHHVHGWLKMGAETGKKGAFKWHDKHPVGGKGKR